jgi:hypothetical protein|nr:MAG TPA: restriction enzyme [Caudoviricetes sp.]
MLVPNQKVEVRWNPQNIRWYEEKGYEYTKTGETFLCKAEDLMPTCKILVSVTCDYCGDVYETKNGDYNKGLKHVQKSSCNKQQCKNNKNVEIQRLHNLNRQYNKFTKLCKERGYTPLTDKEDYVNSHTKMAFLCPFHGEKYSTLANLEYEKFGCDECGRNSSTELRRYPSEKIKQCIESKNNNTWLNQDEFINVSASNLSILCGSCADIYTTSFVAYKNGSGKCPHCRSILAIDDVINRVESKNNNKLLNPEDYVGYEAKNLLIKCGSCGNNFLSSLGNIDFTSGKCHNCSMLLSKQEVSKRIESKNNNKLLNPENYTGYFDKNLIILCGSCNNTYVSSLGLVESSLNGKCKKCSPQSWYEECIASFLDNHKISYTRQETFNGACVDKRPLPFDFYLPLYNLCIEFDGIQHYEPVKWTSSWSNDKAEENLKLVQYHDSIKTKYCSDNNINLFRIPYWDAKNLETILENKLDTKHVKKVLLSNNRIFTYKAHKPKE